MPMERKRVPAELRRVFIVLLLALALLVYGAEAETVRGDLTGRKSRSLSATAIPIVTGAALRRFCLWA